MHVLRSAWRRLKEFSATSGDATYLGPRWLVLRAVGIIYVFIFAGIVAEDGNPLIGPHGLTPLNGLLAQVREQFPNPIESFLRAPTLFWLSTSSGMITALGWCGLVAAVALVLNLWPRLALFACWLIFLSFVSTWLVFSKTQPDQIAVELALVCIPLAPAGFRPGLGERSPPFPLAVFVVRWLLFRLMFEAGLIKLLGGDSQWRNFTAMNAMYETTPFPTLLSYLTHQLPHAYHVFEIIFTFAAELLSPLLALFAGRRGRWFAFIVWTIFQAGIELTNNFGWLNLAAIVLGIALLDDQMLAAAATKLKCARLGRRLLARVATASHPRIKAWRLHVLRTGAWTYFGVSILFFAITCGMPVVGFPFALARPFKFLFSDFHGANSYTLFAGMPPTRYAVEFEGSNDGGRTWRTYPFRYQPQREDQLSPVIAPRYARFEAALQIAGYDNTPSRLFGIVAAHLLLRDPVTLSLFRSDPFPDRPPTMIRMPMYRMSFTNLATHRKTGRFWNKEAGGDYQPMVYLTAQGPAAEVRSILDEVRLKAEAGDAEAQDHLAFVYAHGDDDTPKDAVEAARWYRKAADQGLAAAQFNLGALYETGDGVPKDNAEAARWYRMAAEQGLVDAQFNLGEAYAAGDGVARDSTEAAGWFLKAAQQGDHDAQVNLAGMYLDGRGVTKNVVEGLAWLDLAAASGDQGAAAGRTALEQQLEPVLVAQARQRSQVLAGEIEAHKAPKPR